MFILRRCGYRMFTSLIELGQMETALSLLEVLKDDNPANAHIWTFRLVSDQLCISKRVKCRNKERYNPFIIPFFFCSKKSSMLRRRQGTGCSDIWNKNAAPAVLTTFKT